MKSGIATTGSKGTLETHTETVSANGNFTHVASTLPTIETNAGTNSTTPKTTTTPTVNDGKSTVLSCRCASGLPCQSPGHVVDEHVLDGHVPYGPVLTAL